MPSVRPQEVADIVGFESLEAAIQRAGSAVQVLRHSTVRPHTFPVAPEFTNWRSEQRAWRTSCVLFDQSHHMTDLFVSGPDALRLLSDFGVNTFANFASGKAKQYVAVNSGGYFIGDAILFHLEDGVFDLVGHPTVGDWLQYNAETGDYDVTIQRDDNSHDRSSGPPRLYRYELQGPNAMPLVEKLTGAPPPDVKFFTMTEFTIAGHRVRALRHGMAGQPGFELFGPWAEGTDVLDAILRAGTEFDLVRAGAKAYSTANLESGWIPTAVPAIFGPEMTAYREWLRASAVGSLGGSMDAGDITDYYLTPYDIGYGHTVRFDHDFLGRDALERMAGESHRTKVTLVWNPEDVAAAVRSQYEPGTPAKYIEMPKARYAFFQVDKVLRDGSPVGLSLDLGYLATEQAFVSLATVDAAVSAPGSEVTVLWGEEPNSTKPAVERHRQVEIRATVAPAPYAREARESYRAPRTRPHRRKGTRATGGRRLETPALTLADLVRNISYEVMPFKNAERDVLANVPTAIPLTVTVTEARGIGATLDLTERLVRQGYTASPHLPARQFVDDEHVADVVARLGEAGVRSVFVIGGDAPRPAGRFQDAYSLLRAMEQVRHPFEEVGIGGYPEGHAAIPQEALDLALKQKAPMATRILTQICFDAGATANWAAAVAEAGIDLPIHVGMPGPVNRQKLIRVSAGLGLGQSARFLRKQQGLLWRFLLPGAYDPTRLARRLGAVAPKAGGNIRGLHIFTFNELSETELWRRRLLDGVSGPSERDGRS